MGRPDLQDTLWQRELEAGLFAIQFGQTYLELCSDDQWRLYRTITESLKAESIKNEKNLKKRVYAKRLFTVPELATFSRFSKKYRKVFQHSISYEIPLKIVVLTSMGTEIYICMYFND